MTTATSQVSDNIGVPMNIVIKIIDGKTIFKSVFSMEDIEDEQEDYYYGISGGTV